MPHLSNGEAKKAEFDLFSNTVRLDSPGTNPAGDSAMRVVLIILGLGWLSFAAVFVLAIMRAARKQAIEPAAEQSESAGLKQAA